MSLVRWVPYDWVRVCYSLKKEVTVCLISKGWNKHSSLFTRQKPGAIVQSIVHQSGLLLLCVLLFGFSDPYRHA